MKWEKRTLGEVLTLKRGYDLPSQFRKNGLVPIISSCGVTDYHSEMAKTGEGVVTGRYGTLGQIFYVNGDYWPLNTTLYVQDFKGNLPKFIYYFLQTLNLKNYNSASAVPGLDRNVLHQIEINFISEGPAQRRIASILSAYDVLIENNLKRIKLLEEKAFLSYKCINRDSHDVKAEKKKLKDVLDLKYGKALKADNRTIGKYPVFGSSGIVGSHESYLVDGPGIVVGRKGNVGSVFWSFDNFWVIDTAYYVESKIGLYYLYFNLKEQHFVNTDAAVPGLNRNFALDNPIILPPINEITLFENSIKSVFQLMQNLHKQNTKLREARDILLPKLMSGEIEV